MFGTSMMLTVLLLVGMVLVAEGLYRLRWNGLRPRLLLWLVGGAVPILFTLGWLASASSTQTVTRVPITAPPSVQPGFSPNYDTPARKRYKRKEGLDIGRYEA